MSIDLHIRYIEVAAAAADNTSVLYAHYLLRYDALKLVQMFPPECVLNDLFMTVLLR